jgi:DNA-binding SARP family transcriptional activator
MEAWVQICGRVVAVLDGRRVEESLPGRQERLLFTYLVAHRLRPSTRDELIDALWPQNPPPGAETSLSALLSKLRTALGADRLTGRSSLCGSTSGTTPGST